MIKTYCDSCDSEITDKNKIGGENFRLRGVIHRKGKSVMEVEVVTSNGYTWNSGDFCKYCVIDAVNQADDRPRHVESCA